MAPDSTLTATEDLRALGSRPVTPGPALGPDGYTDDNFAPFEAGREQWPHFTEISVMEAAMAIACTSYVPGAKVRNILIGPKSYWARYFRGVTQSGAYDGTGIVLFTAGMSVASAGRFAICQHEKIAGANARPHVGWHPAKCGKCGIDLSVDSGD